ncbi:MAG: hypothetical protein WBJ81_02465 [Rickettsiales bacterium]
MSFVIKQFTEKNLDEAFEYLEAINSRVYIALDTNNNKIAQYTCNEDYVLNDCNDKGGKFIGKSIWGDYSADTPCNEGYTLASTLYIGENTYGYCCSPEEI